jgi:hypothetical protein
LVSAAEFRDVSTNCCTLGDESADTVGSGGDVISLIRFHVTFTAYHAETLPENVLVPLTGKMDTALGRPTMSHSSKRFA